MFNNINKLYRLLIMILTATMLFACKDDEETASDGSAATLEVSDADKSYSFDLNGGSKTVSVTANAMFTVEMAATDWLTVSGTGITGFKINVDENVNVEPRSAKLILSAKGAENIEIDVSQSGSPLKVSQPEATFDPGYGDKVVSVNAKVFTATAGGADWVTATVSDKTLRIQTNPNAGDERRATVTLRSEGTPDATLTVIQEAYVPPTLSISTQLVEFDYGAADTIVEITSNRSVFTVEFEEGVTWLDADFSGSILRLKPEINLSDADRSTRITVNVYGLEEMTVTVTQTTYLRVMVNRTVNAVTKFNNGYAVGLGEASGGDYSELYYKNKQGADAVTQVLPEDESACLYDYDGSELSIATLYRLDPSSETMYSTPKVAYDGEINDRATVLTSAPEGVIINPGDFDIGGEGIAFHNTTSSPDKNSVSYRRDMGDAQSDDIPLEFATQDMERPNMGRLATNGWVNYTIVVQDAGNYEIDFNVTLSSGSANLSIYVDEVEKWNEKLINNVSWTDWRYYCEFYSDQVTPAPTVYLTAGNHVIKVYTVDDGWKFNGLRLTYKP
jgi:hypothetical protein